ncbi:TetR/AcrR family transcriptional regulator [Pseudoroseicyclus sp. CXY001]|uniref:TetR/AcrR family transcriptional regulator n=1 Tax=Pseudoroseicyclus sp. CXY001 TaxID=3242492 RepID=UPI003570CDEB
MTPAAPEPKKIPKQARAIATCAAIVEAAARILEEQGPEALTTNRIAERAGVGIGTLYQYFPDKHAILVSLIRRERGALLSELRGIEAEGDAALGEMIAASIRHQFDRPKLASALEHIEQAFPLGPEAAAMAEEIAALSSDLLGRRFAPVERTDLLTAVLIARTIVNAAGDGLLPQDGLAERVERAVRGYLTNVTSRA